MELLGDGRHFGLALTYRYQRGALGIAHAIGLARDFIGDDAFCVVLGDNILRGQALETTALAFEAGPWGAGTGRAGRCRRSVWRRPREDRGGPSGKQRLHEP